MLALPVGKFPASRAIPTHANAFLLRGLEGDGHPGDVVNVVWWFCVAGGSAATLRPAFLEQLCPQPTAYSPPPSAHRPLAPTVVKCSPFICAQWSPGPDVSRITLLRWCISRYLVRI